LPTVLFSSCTLPPDGEGGDDGEGQVDDVTLPAVIDLDDEEPLQRLFQGDECPDGTNSDDNGGSCETNIGEC